MAAPTKICSCPAPADQDRLIQFTNCRLVRGHQLLRDDLWVRDGKIINPEPIFFDEQSKAHSRIDCGGAIIAPGYLDLQINGEAVLQYIQSSTSLPPFDPPQNGTFAAGSISRQGRPFPINELDWGQSNRSELILSGL